MTSPLLKVSAAGTVDLTQSTINMLANPEIVAGPEGQGGANDLAGLSVPVRIEGPLDRPTIRPEIKSMFANPEKAGKTINQIGDALQKKFKGKPVGEAIGRFLGNVQIGPRNGDGGGDAQPQSNKQRSGKKDSPQAKPAPEEGAAEQGDSDEPGDPELDQLLALGRLPRASRPSQRRSARLAYNAALDAAIDAAGSPISAAMATPPRPRAEDRLCQPGLPQGPGRFRAHHHRLRSEGYELSASYQGADAVVVNTCGFLNSAKEESLAAIGEALAENGRVIVTGCLGVEAERIRAAHPASARHHRPASI